MQQTFTSGTRVHHSVQSLLYKVILHWNQELITLYVITTKLFIIIINVDFILVVKL